MFKMKSPILHFLLLIPRVSLNFTLDSIHKCSRVPQIFAKECLKLVPHDWDKAICVLFPLILLQAEADLLPKKGRSKRNLVKAFGSSSNKVILILLIEVIALLIGFTVVYVQGLGFQGLVLDNLPPNSRGEKELRRAIKKRSLQKQPWPQTEVILEQAF